MTTMTHHDASCRRTRRRTTRATSSRSGVPGAATSASCRRSTARWRPSAGRRTRSRSSRASAARAAFPATRRRTASTRVHGRALPIAQGIKLAQPDLLVLVAGGDGDGFSIGGGHVAARHPPQHRPHLHRDGQPDLRPDQGAAVADVAARAADRVVARTAASRIRSTRCSTCSATARRFVAQGTPADMTRLADAHRRGHPLPGLRLHQRPVAVRHLRRGRRAAEGAQGADEDARVARPRPGRSAAGDGPGAATTARTLYTGVFYRDPSPEPTYEALALERQRSRVHDGRVEGRHPRHVRAALTGAS